MSALSPRLTDVRISLDLISPSGPAAHISPRAYRALVSLVSCVAGDLVWTYTAPGDGSLPDDDDQLCRLSFMGKRAWRSVRPEVERFFVVKDGRWHLSHEWIEIDERRSRFALPVDIRATVAAREGKRCTYCGDTDGPFDFDHIFPKARGGTDAPSNLTLACASCNRSKGAKTLREWVAG